MRGFGGRLQTFLRASLQQRVPAGTPSVLQHGATAASSAAAVRTSFQQSLLEEVPLLHSAVSGFRHFRCCSLLHDSINVEVASMGESITGVQPFALESSFPGAVSKDWSTSIKSRRLMVRLACRGVHCCNLEATRQWRGGR